MKRYLTIATAMLLVLFSSCVRSEDLDLLRHPIHVQGEVDPYLGIPIAYGELTLNDLYDMLSANYSGYLDSTSDVVTIVFDATAQDIIHASGYNPETTAAPMVNLPKDDAKNFVDFIDTVLEYSVDITIFDDARLSSVTEADLAINHLWFSLNTIYQGHCVPSFEDVVRNHVRAVADSLVVKYTDHNYVQHVFTGLPSIEPIAINNVLDRQVLRFDSIDISPLINSLPRKITASFRFRFSVDDAWIVNNITNPSFAQMMDTIKMTYLEYDATAWASFPFEVHIGLLPYEFSVDLGDGLATVNIDSILNTFGDNVDAELKDSYINLAFDNGIPFNFMVNVTMLDADSSFLFEVVDRDTILSAPTDPLPSDPSTLGATGTTRTIVRAMLNQQKLQLLKEARKMRISLAMSTGPGNVAVQRSNSLKVKASVQVHPSVGIDIPLFDKPILH